MVLAVVDVGYNGVITERSFFLIELIITLL